MKKIYIIPTMDVIKIQTTVGMLAGSNVDMNDKGDSKDAGYYGLSRSFSFDDEDEDEY